MSKCSDLIELRLQSTDAAESTFVQICSTCAQLQVLLFSRCSAEALPLARLQQLQHLHTLDTGWSLFSSEDLAAWVDTFEASPPVISEVGAVCVLSAECVVAVLLWW